MGNQHILKRGNGWAVRKEGASRDTSVLETQASAIKEATLIAKNQGGDVIVHGRDNLIRERNTYGKVDHHPPKG